MKALKQEAQSSRLKGESKIAQSKKFKAQRGKEKGERKNRKGEGGTQAKPGLSGQQGSNCQFITNK